MALPARSRSKASNHQKGESNLLSKTCDGKEVYDSWDDKHDKYAERGSGQPCSSGRADVMRLYVEPRSL